MQLRSNKFRAYIDLFLRKLTHFLSLTHLYPTLKATYLKLYHIRNWMAVKVSNMNHNTNKLWSLNKSILVNMRRSNFNYQAELATSILLDYLPIHNYCHYNEWLSVDLCIT